MTNLFFFEKPGCITNYKQKKLLEHAGIIFQVRSLLDEPWKADRLKLFFEGMPVNEWINPNAPQVKSGEVDPNSLSAEQAIEKMLEQPLLIRRPLFEQGDTRWCGFNWEKICANTGLDESSIPRNEEPENCSLSENHAECP